MGRLTTHILDTVRGGPAPGVDIRLFMLGETRKLVASARTDSDGRTPHPLVENERMAGGSYELEFDVGTYFRDCGVEVAEPPFLDTVVIRINVDGAGEYHVPLLVSPWAYSTYRGS